MPEQSERRRWTRVAIAVPMFISATQDQKKYLEFGTAVNVSAGGVLLAARSYLQPSSRVVLEIPSGPLPDSAFLQTSHTITGQLVRVEADAHCYLLAVQFDEPLGSDLSKPLSSAGKKMSRRSLLSSQDSV